MRREDGSRLQMKKKAGDDHIINEFSVVMELICYDYCPLKASLFLRAIDAGTLHDSHSDSAVPRCPHSCVNTR